jgi:hypothetical protein
MWLLSDDADLSPGDDPVEIEEDLTFRNRSGRDVPVSLSLRAEPSELTLAVSASLDYDGTVYDFELLANEDEGFELSEDIGIVQLQLDGEWRYSRWELGYAVRRTDIEQGMFR